MDMVLRGLVLFAVCISTKSELRMTITPNKVDVEDDLPVTIRCSLNLRQPKTDRVYAIMLSRRDKTIVSFSSMEHLPDNVVGELNGSDGFAFLQINLRNVTCKDRGDYSCKMAVRRDFRNIELGPTSSSFAVIERPSPIQVQVHSTRASSAVGQAVNITCSALKKSNGSDWLWTLRGISNQMAESCTYSESSCLYRCSSCISCTVMDGYSDSMAQCGYAGRIKRFALNATRKYFEGAISDGRNTTVDSSSTVEVVEEVSSNRPQAVNIDTTQDVYHYEYKDVSENKEHQHLLKNILVYSFISVFALLFLVILWLFMSDQRRCRKFRRTGTKFNKHGLINVENHFMHNSHCSGSQLYLHPTLPVPHQVHPYTTRDSETNSLLHHQIHQVNQLHRPYTDKGSDAHKVHPFTTRDSETNRLLHHQIHQVDHVPQVHRPYTDKGSDARNILLSHQVHSYTTGDSDTKGLLHHQIHHLHRPHTCTNGHFTDTISLTLPHHEDSTETSSTEHIYEEVGDVCQSDGVPTGLVRNTVGD